MTDTPLFEAPGPADLGTVLIIDDEPDIRKLVALSLARIGVDASVAANLEEARQLLATYRFDACLCDMKLPDGDGVAFVAELHEQYPALPVAVITAHGQVESAVEAMRNGAFDFVSKPVDIHALRRLVTQALSLKPQAAAPSTASVSKKTSDAPDHTPASNDTGTELVNGKALIGSSEVMQDLRKRIKKVAHSNAPVWITGESGTGKELIAQLIHANSARADQAFIAINCGAIPNELVESELFGHTKGSFTGAHQDKEGLFKAADGGTLFLDEVAELPLHMQVKVLRAIQERAIRPVGTHTEQAIDVRLLSATHNDLAECVAAGSFRQDLYYRLNVISITSPALRDRNEDIPALVDAILARLSDEQQNSFVLDDTALRKLTQYHFPGNVRELENVLARACALADRGNINGDELELTAASTETAASPSSPPVEVDEERDRILHALDNTRWNRRQAAEELGMTYRQLRYRIQQLGLDKGNRAA